MTNQTSNSDNSIINAVKRLERAGDANSKANQKLHAAVVTVADFLIDTIPVGIKFDKHYDNGELLSWSEVEVARPWNGDLYGGRQLRTGMGVLRPGQGFVSCNYLPERDTEQMFARSIAEGLIERVLEAVEKATSEAVADTERVKEAVAGL
jgi:hypothetical protein